MVGAASSRSHRQSIADLSDGDLVEHLLQLQEVARSGPLNSVLGIPEYTLVLPESEPLAYVGPATFGNKLNNSHPSAFVQNSFVGLPCFVLYVEQKETHNEASQQHSVGYNSAFVFDIHDFESGEHRASLDLGKLLRPEYPML